MIVQSKTTTALARLASAKIFQPRLFMIAVMLITTWPVFAQEKQAQNSDSLKNGIERLKAINVDGKSAVVQENHKRALLSLYDRLRLSLQQDIVDLENIQAAVGDVDPSAGKETANQIQRLLREQKEVADKIQVLTKELSAAAPTNIVSSPPVSSPSVTGPSTSSSPASSAFDSSANNNSPSHSNGSPAPSALASSRAEANTSRSTPAAPDRTRAVPITNAAQPPQANCYADAPPAAVDQARAAAEIVIKRKIAGATDSVAAAEINSLVNELMIYVVADAITAPDSTEKATLRQLNLLQVKQETARTDKQLGASASANGSTSAVEKPGFADLLSFAIEHGGIQQAVNGTTLTLSTSPYALIAMGSGDTATTYQNYEFFNRVGVSANFNISNQDMLLTNARRSQLAEWSVRMRLSGDRSTRSKTFEEFWNDKVRPQVERIPKALTGALRQTFTQEAGLEPVRRNIVDNLPSLIEKYLQDNQSKLASDEAKTGLQQLILCQLKVELLDKIRSRALTINSATQNELTRTIQELIDAQADLAKANDSIKKEIDRLNKKPLATFSYTNHRVAMGSDYSAFKFLYERKTFSPMKIVANAGLSVYHRPDLKMNQQSVRDFAAALSFEGNVKSPFTTNELDQSQITFSFSGRYQRMLENRHIMGKKADIGVAQFKVEIPLFTGVSIPFSVTYANATELIKEDHVRANFGFSFDADKLFALRKLLLKQ